MPRRRFTQPKRKEPNEAIKSLEASYPTQDTIARSLGAKSTFGSIEAIEEARFPWLKKRRQARPPKEEFDDA